MSEAPSLLLDTHAAIWITEDQRIAPAAIEAIGRIHADVYFIGGTGIHPEIGLTTGDLEEAHRLRRKGTSLRVRLAEIDDHEHGAPCRGWTARCTG